LSDIILLGTEEQVRLAANAARELATGKLVHTHELVVSRDFIREALDLDPIPADLAIPLHGPARAGASVVATRLTRPRAIKVVVVAWVWEAAWVVGLVLESGSHHEAGDDEDGDDSSPHHV